MNVKKKHNETIKCLTLNISYLYTIESIAIILQILYIKSIYIISEIFV